MLQNKIDEIKSLAKLKHNIVTSLEIIKKIEHEFLITDEEKMVFTKEIQEQRNNDN